MGKNRTTGTPIGRSAVVLALAVAAVLAVSALAGAEARGGSDASLPEPDRSWFEGAAGFDAGWKQAQATNQAVLVYFYTDWCGYCRQLESRLLETEAVEKYTQYLVKIRINPERGAAERAFASHYRVRGYPAVFVHTPGPSGPKRFSRMTSENGKPKLLSPAGFVERLTSATGVRIGPS